MASSPERMLQSEITTLSQEDEEFEDELQELQAEERVEPVGTDLDDKIDWDN